MIACLFVAAPFVIVILAVRANHLHAPVDGYSAD